MFDTHSANNIHHTPLFLNLTLIEPSLYNLGSLDVRFNTSNRTGFLGPKSTIQLFYFKI